MTKKLQPRSDGRVGQVDLTSLLSHELRTPLNAIIGFAEMLDREVLGKVGNQRYREYARHIRDSGTHLSDIISDMLNVMPTDGNALPAEPIDPTSAIDDCLGILRIDAEAAGVRLDGRNPKTRVRLLANQTAVTKILTVLVRDAISSARRDDRITVCVDIAARRQGLAYSIERSWPGGPRPSGGKAIVGRGQPVSPLHRQPVPPDLRPAIWNWLVRLNGGRLDLQRGAGRGWSARVGFPEQMLRRLRKTLDCGPGRAGP